MADLSALSTEDLLALKAGNLSKVSTEGLLALKQKPSSQIPEFEKEAMRIRDAGPAEIIAGNPVTRFALGAATPILGGLQLFSNLAGTGNDSRNLFSNQRLAQLEALKQRGREAYGSSGLDVPEIAGNVLSPVGLAAVKALPVASSLLGRTGQGAALGGAFGATTPVTKEGSYWEPKLEQTTAGATVGGVIPPVAAAVGAGGKTVYHGMIEPWLDPLTVKGRTLFNAGGDKAEELIQALRNARQDATGMIPTSGQAGANVEAPGFAALAQAGRERLPQIYNQRLDQQNAAQLAALGTIGKDSKAFRLAEQLRAENARRNYGAVGNDLINSASDAEIMASAIGQRQAASSGAVQDVRRLSTAQQLADELAQSGRMRLDSGAPPDPGIPRIAGRYSYGTELANLADRKASEAANTSLQQGAERRYLEDFTRMLSESGDLDTTSLRTFLSRPSVQDAVKIAMRGAKETGDYFPGKGEPFSVNNLQRIKAAISDVISDPKNTQGLQATERKEIGDTLSGVIDWLSNKSPGWKAARLQYAEDSLHLNQMQVGQYLESTAGRGWQPNAGGQPLNAKAYIEALRKSTDVGDTAMAGRAAELVSKRVTGAPRYTELAGPEGPMNPQQMDLINAVKENMLRQQRLEGQAKTGISQLRELTPVPKGEDIQLWNRKMSVYHWLKRHAIGMANENLANQLAKDMLDPQVTANMMTRYVAKQDNAKMLADLLSRYSRPVIGAGIQQTQGQ